MITLLWKIVAWIVSRPLIVDWLIQRALKTPYSHLYKGDDLYMERFWLFNPYPSRAEGDRRKALGLPRKTSIFPSIRLHKIHRKDTDDHPHDHPWEARTIILRNPYIEERLVQGSWMFEADRKDIIMRRPGDTARIRFGEYHKIVSVPKEGVWTMFITWKFQGTWGFLVDGKKVPYKEYLGIE